MSTVSTEPYNRAIDTIRTDGQTQFRARIDEATVTEYAGLMKDGVQFPAVDVVVDEAGTHWLWHGFHRLAAAKQAGRELITVRARPGTLRDAVLLALSANHDNGLTRTNDDKRKAVVFCLRDPEIRAKTQREIAALCGVTQAMVSKVKGELYPKPKKGKAAQSDAPDNGYQALASQAVPTTPEEALALLTDEQKAEFLDRQTRGGSFYGAKEAAPFERAGLITRYSSGSEFTPLGNETAIRIAAADPLLALEKALWEWDRTRDTGRAWLSGFGALRAALTQLYDAGGWVDEDALSYRGRDWLQATLSAPITRGTVVKRHTVKSADFGEAAYWHILPKGCALIGREPLVFADGKPTAPQPTVEAYEQAERACREQSRAAAAQHEAERVASLDPQKEAARARENILWHLRSVTSALDNAKFLDTSTARRVAGQLKSIVESAPVVDPREKSDETRAFMDGDRVALAGTTITGVVEGEGDGRVEMRSDLTDVVLTPDADVVELVDAVNDADGETEAELGASPNTETVEQTIYVDGETATRTYTLLPMQRAANASRALLEKARDFRADADLHGAWFNADTPGFEETPRSLLDVLTARGWLEVRETVGLHVRSWRISEAGRAVLDQCENEGDAAADEPAPLDTAPHAQPEMPFAKHSFVWHKQFKRVGKVFGSMYSEQGIEVLVSDPTLPSPQELQSWKLDEVRQATGDEVWLMTEGAKEAGQETSI